MGPFSSFVEIEDSSTIDEGRRQLELSALNIMFYGAAAEASVSTAYKVE
jgi:hypothetical protein